MLRKINLIRGIPGEGLYGWGVVGGAFISHFLSYGTLVVAFGIFFPFMASSLGWGRGLLASAIVLGYVNKDGAAELPQNSGRAQKPRVFFTLFISIHCPWQRKVFGCDLGNSPNWVVPIRS